MTLYDNVYRDLGIRLGYLYFVLYKYLCGNFMLIINIKEIAGTL